MSQESRIHRKICSYDFCCATRVRLTLLAVYIQPTEHTLVERSECAAGLVLFFILCSILYIGRAWFLLPITGELLSFVMVSEFVAIWVDVRFLVFFLLFARIVAIIAIIYIYSQYDAKCCRATLPSHILPSEHIKLLRRYSECVWAFVIGTR